jgi:hypothetical protein
MKKIFLILFILVVNKFIVFSQPNNIDKKICKKLLSLNFKKIEKANISVDSLIKFIDLNVIDTILRSTNPVILNGLYIRYSKYVSLIVDIDIMNCCNRLDSETWNKELLIKEKISYLRLSFDSKIIKETPVKKTIHKPYSPPNRTP